ncbi:MAG: hypothetical protein DRQ10_04215 [Candidatus Hydrothermota bacterium]|nr:MAG: hypothetical protein DRQ10_04215 [Candidatus Hydrothermae bacterium]
MLYGEDSDALKVLKDVLFPNARMIDWDEANAKAVVHVPDKAYVIMKSRKLGDEVIVELVFKPEAE